MALSALCDDALGVVFGGLRNVLDPRDFVYCTSANKGLRVLTQALLQQLRADHEVAAALCREMGLRSCKALREAKLVYGPCCFSTTDLATLGTLGSVLPALEELHLCEPSAGPDGVQRLAEKLGAGALPAATFLNLGGTCVGDAGASAQGGGERRCACIAHRHVSESELSHGR